MIKLTDDVKDGFRMRLNFRNPEKMKFGILFVARTLGRIGRFNHIPNRHLSVAEHSVNASYLYPSNPLGALMHDCPEAITGDITTHLKSELSDFKELEKRIEEDMARRFGYTKPGPDFKCNVDQMLFYAEEKFLFGAEDCHYPGVELPIKINCWSAEEATWQFLLRYEELKGDIV